MKARIQSGFFLTVSVRSSFDFHISGRLLGILCLICLFPKFIVKREKFNHDALNQGRKVMEVWAECLDRRATMAAFLSTPYIYNFLSSQAILCPSAFTACIPSSSFSTSPLSLPTPIPRPTMIICPARKK